MEARGYDQFFGQRKVILSDWDKKHSLLAYYFVREKNKWKLKERNRTNMHNFACFYCDCELLQKSTWTALRLADLMRLFIKQFTF